MPYNYLVDPSSRQNLNIQWNQSVVIIDEAHNLESVCDEAASFTLRSADIARCVEDIDRCIQRTLAKQEYNPATAKENEQQVSKDFLVLKKALLLLEQAIDEVELRHLQYGHGVRLSYDSFFI